MKILFIIFTMFISNIVQSQLMSGSVIDSNRKKIDNNRFEMLDTHAGVIFFELAVNPEGKVCSAKILNEQTTIISTPTRIRAKQQVLKYTFEPGTHFPDFQHVIVKFKVIDKLTN